MYRIIDYWKLLTSKADVVLLTQGGGWIIDNICGSISDVLGSRVIVVRHINRFFCKNKIIHFVARYAIFNEKKLKALAKKNKIIVSWWHGGVYKNGNKEYERLNDYLENFARLAYLIDKIHISSSIYKRVLIEKGISAEKIVCLPQGIDLGRFQSSFKKSLPTSLYEREETNKNEIKKRLGISQDIFCIGSFQRDGKDEPKLVKGPDVLVDALKKIHKKEKKILALLTGPNRNYVMKQLDKEGIPYKYVGILPSSEVPLFYKALDLYIVSSREEGGPAAILEAMASGVPFIATKVGMAVDIIENNKNGILVDIEDSDAIARNTFHIIKDRSLGDRLVQNAFETVKKYDWKIIAKDYETKLYSF